METVNQPSPKLSWDLGTAYDLFISLAVLHQPERFGLRPSWAAGVRSRLSAEERRTLEEGGKLFPSPLHWVYSLPQPKDSASALWALEQVPAGERLAALALVPGGDAELAALLRRVAATGQWNEADLESLREAYRREHRDPPRPKAAAEILDLWTQAEDFGRRYLAALQAYRQAFFAEEERRILPALQAGLQRAQELAQHGADLQGGKLVHLIEQLSQGVSIPDLLERDELVFVPSYWGTPLIFVRKLAQECAVFSFGVRPQHDSLVPGDAVPDALLQALKAMADPTRLRILRYLAQEPLTPADLARRLRLRPPTLTHHLSILRLAGLVHITLESGDQRRYAARQEGLEGLPKQIQDFLASGSNED